MSSFLFLGNGAFNNHGCEAIVRGTMEILRASFGGTVTATNLVTEPRSVVEEQERNFPLEGVRSEALNIDRNFTFRLRRKLAAKTHGELKTAQAQIRTAGMGATAMLAIGGDNFSLDYGAPYSFLGWNGVAHELGLPVVIWGASVGPFRANPAFERQFVRHAAKVRLFLVRESESKRYLESLGLGAQVRQVADPAFAMRPEPVGQSLDLPAEAIGINLSPLMAKYVTNGDREAWLRIAREVVRSVVASTDRPVVLVPHVNTTEVGKAADPGWPNRDDHGFLSRVMEDAEIARGAVTLLPDTLNAAELKGVIARFELFMGSRTHATIAAFSSSVPTLSFAYSVKALGLNRDLFGTDDFCLQPNALTPANVAEKVKMMKSRKEEIRARYAETLPRVKQAAFSAGEALREILG